MDDAIFKLIGEAVKGGYAIPLYFIIGWKMWKDMEAKKELNEKKKSGEYVSWESMNERISGMEEKLNGHIEKSTNHDVEIGKLQTLTAEHEKSDQQQFGHIFDQHTTIFAKLDTMTRDMNDNFKELMKEIKNRGI